ncbi:MAG: V-type ATP synthase subunit D [Oscillospiraceae bacterium]|jgi:V/A-type H+-transporting ATPase subunit D|nr:V-type ATP synthase subunit D [Oscillospiraceae bacterium]
MIIQVALTKANLMSTKRILEISRNGFSLLDKKCSILTKELMALLGRAKEIKGKIDAVYHDAYSALQEANISLGICEEAAMSVSEENKLQLSSRSVMGVEIPILSLEESDNFGIAPFGLYNTNSYLDKAFLKFEKVKKLTVKFAEVENSIYRLTYVIKKTKKRANALKNAIIPEFEALVKNITNSLEEKEREEFIRQKVIKNAKKV